MLYVFKGGDDGKLPLGALTMVGGVLYGATPQGGARDFGTVFALAPPTSSGGSWTKSLVYSFKGGGDGANPDGSLINVGGTLYGTTHNGGADHVGTVFALAPPTIAGGSWTETLVYSFAGGSDPEFWREVQHPRRFDIGKVVQDLKECCHGIVLHLSEDERDQIGVLRAAGQSMGAIARALGRAKTTISRELQRNALPSGGYLPLHAAGAYQLRRRREAILEREAALRLFVGDRLAEGWTPEQISGWLKSGNEPRLRAIGEADRMLDMGFLPDISRILQLLPKERQSLMFSATFSEEIKRLAANFLRDPVLVEVAQRNATAANVRQELVHVHESEKGAALMALLQQRDLAQVLVFVNTKIGARRLARQLQRDGVQADAIHGDKTQDERMKALEAFKAGALRVLVATDVAARGLDITELPGVINYDVPFAPEDYIHRIGRTARAGASGCAITIACGADDKAVAAIERLIKIHIEPVTLDLGVPRRAPREESHEVRAPRVSGPHRAEGRRGREEHRGGRGRAPVVAAVDDFFLKPYQPEAAEAGAVATQVPAHAAGAIERKPERRGALLGGIKKVPSET